MNELRKLNFNELISVGVPDVTSYTFDKYKKNGYEHTPINGYCTSCEEKGCSSAAVPPNQQYKGVMKIWKLQQQSNKC